MTLAELIPLVLKTSIWLVVLSLGMSAPQGSLSYVLRRPALLARSLFSMLIVMLVVAIILLKVMNLPHPVGIMLVCLALAPIPPLLPNRMTMAKANMEYGMGLLVAAAVVAVVWIPVAVELLEPIAGIPLHAEAMPLAKLVLLTLVLPLALGMIFQKFAPALAAKAGKILSTVGMLLLLAAFIPVVIKSWPQISGLAHDGSVLAIILFVVGGVIAGYLLGGPAVEDRSVLALASCARHPGIAIAIAKLNFPDEPSIVPAALLYLLVSVVASLPFVLWRKKAGGVTPPAKPA